MECDLRWVSINLDVHNLFIAVEICLYGTVLGNSRKYPYPTTDGFHVLTPPLAFRNSRMHYPPCPQNSIIMNPPTLRNFLFFWKCIFDLATPISTNEHDFMPPQGCDPAAPGDKLYSSATRKTYRMWPGCANSFLSLNLAIKINTSHSNFLLFVFLCCFDVYKAK